MQGFRFQLDTPLLLPSDVNLRLSRFQFAVLRCVGARVGSWRGMYLTNPPIKLTMYVSGFGCGVERCLGVGGCTLGELVDGACEVMLREGDLRG